MKVLEETPDEYEMGIVKITSGMIKKVYGRILDLIEEGHEVIDLGCGPGTLAILCAKKGAQVVAIDASEEMIIFATEKSQKEGVSDNITFIHGDITQLETLLPKKKFDFIVSTLALSELRHLEQQLVFNQCWNLLKEEGKIAFADEVIPSNLGMKRLIYSIKRKIYGIATYWKTKKTTHDVKRFHQRLKSSGFESLQTHHFASDTFELNIAQKTMIKPPPPVLSDHIVRGIKGRIRNIFCILRSGSSLIPIEAGLYIYGNPTNQSPVLVTANYQRTVRIVSEVIKNQDVYLLVADSLGENVWCAARGDKFGLKEVTEVIKATRIEELVQHKEVILPQLAAGGINHRELKTTIGWSSKFGPIYAKYIPQYLKTGKKTEKQRTITFDQRERFEMAVQQSYFLSKFFFFWLFFIGIMGVIVLPQVYLFYIAILLLPILWLSYLIFAFIFPLFPTRSFLRRGIYYGGLLAIFFIGVGNYLDGTLIGSFQWSVIGFILGTFLGMDYSGASPISKPSEIDKEYPTMIILIGGSIIILILLILIRFVIGS